MAGRRALLSSLFLCSLAPGLPHAEEPTLRVGGLLQVQADLGDRGDTRWDNANDRFLLRRARLSVQGRFLEEFEFKLEADAAGTLSATSGLRLQLTDGYVDWKRSELASLRMGQFKTPFGYEQLHADPRLLTPERSLANDRLTLSRQLGLQVGGEVLEGRLSYAAGLFNGTGANNNSNDDDQFVYVARLAGVLFQGTGRRLTLGGNGFTSTDTAVALSSDFGFDSTPATPAADNLFSGERVGTGVDVQWQMGRFEVWAEVLSVKFEPDDALPAAELRAEGGYAQAGFFVLPKRLQAVLKYETFDPSDQVDGDDLDTWSAGVNLSFKGDDLKLQAHYMRAEVPGTDEKDGKAIVRMQVVF